MASGTPLQSSLLIVGGDTDPNITALLSAAERSCVPCQKLLVGKSSHPSLTWHLESGELRLEGERLDCSAAFVRHDVFTALQDGQASSYYRASAWYTAVTGWLATHPEIVIFNRGNLNHVTNKPLVLKLARDCGLDVPETLITNDVERLAHDEEKVVKPINGGGYCEPLAKVLERTTLKDGRAAAPAIIQRRLVPPEIRIYAVGDQYFGFNVISSELDYRSTQNCRVEFIEDELSRELTEAFGKLLVKLGLDFAAADFKTCPATGRLLFLEVNTGPMFAAFNHASNGRLCNAMLEYLTNNQQ